MNATYSYCSIKSVEYISFEPFPKLELKFNPRLNDDTSGYEIIDTKLQLSTIFHLYQEFVNKILRAFDLMFVGSHYYGSHCTSYKASMLGFNMSHW